ncbi:DUF2807 domain-containing protein [Mucilaginibacter mali]|uniref:DUF2807 domain-containing protein n=1 Tax=Mucilaginibacter mali TaxID=2740462 RepID=A0A7D4TVR0_9SPHI|nr:DUF2807 domain-containing protein [Mucilaginibacter mali]QKJ28757.1 DUF2807 domain-containing protein [Mucilaginibacter mali]
MKTSIITLATLLAIATISNTAFAADKKDKTVTVINEAKNFNKIEVRGNVEVYLTNGPANSVKAYNNYYGESALVQNQNGTLRISSFSKEALVVYVTADDLSAITLYDNAYIKTGKNFSSLDLTVNLFDTATAQLDIQTVNASININNRAKADLVGKVENCDMQVNQASTVNSTNFVAGSLTKKVNGFVTEVKSNQELAIL